MSSSGYVHFYTCDGGLDPLALITGTFRLEGASIAQEIWRTTGEEKGWKQFCEAIGRPTDPEWDGSSTDLNPGEPAPENMEKLALCVDVELSQVLPMWKAGTCLDVGMFKDGDRWRILEQRLRQNIPESIRGGFVPTSISCRVGWHDIFDAYEVSVGRFIARAYYSLRLFGWGHPNDWPEYQRQLFAAPVIVELKRDAERFAGPLQGCIVFEG